MTQAKVEDLSAGIDGELAREELRFLLRRLDHDAELRQAWGRYHVARDGLRRQLPPLASAGFAARVEQAIAREAQAGRRMPHWLRWSSGGAIAAGVAVAALMLARPTGGEGDHVAPMAAAPSRLADAAPAATAQPSMPAAVPPWLSGDNASRYSQQAAATFGGDYGEMALPYARSLSPYRLQRSTVPGNGYLLLIDPAQQPVVAAPQASAAAQ